MTGKQDPRRRAADALRASEERLAAQSEALTELTARHADHGVRYEDRLRAILETSARTLGVARLSMWCFDADRNAISCTCMHEAAPREPAAPARIHRETAPAYFAALDRDRVVASEDVASDPRTRELYEAYLAPAGIGAMLDVPLRQNNVTMGVLCAEHVGGPRAWTVDEQNFALSTANLVIAAASDQERRHALAQLAESEARARLIIDTAHDAFIGMDARGRIVSWNAQAEATFGWTREEALGRRLAETVIPEAFREAHNLGLQRFLETGAAPVVNKRLELTALDRAGREFPVEITITEPIRDGATFTFGAFLRDISERRERDAQLRRARDEAEAATRAKSEFLANMSHELRTPLNGVLGYTQLLQRDRSLSGVQREALDAIAQCGSHLLELINDVLDLSKVESGRVDIEPVTTDLLQLTSDLEYVLAESARSKGLDLVLSIAPEVPRSVVLDGRHLRQVLINLVGNAVKFTSEGEVRLSIALASPDRLHFDVRDTGVGIESDAIDDVFDAFMQTPTGAAAGGTGLGLAISKRLVETMGGTLEVESAPGRGTRFFFGLPLALAADAGDERAIDFEVPPLFDARLAPGQDVTALVADDSTVNRRILARLLESAGARVIQATGGLEAIDLARRHRPDVIFMDLKMPDLDGLTATTRLGADPATARIPVIAVSASAFGDTREAARAAGCADYLPKPVRAESLFATLQLHLGVAFTTHARERAPRPPLEASIPDATRRAAIAARIAAASSIGSVTDLELLVAELMASGGAEAAAGEQIGELAARFDFQALQDLARALAGQPQ